MIQKILRDHPDINKTEELVQALKEIEVLGGYSRSGTIINGEIVPDRYIETLGDYYSDFQIRKAVEFLKDNSFTAAGIDGVVTHFSKDYLQVEAVDPDAPDKTYTISYDRRETKAEKADREIYS